ncbi:MAG: outer membrane protein assembly factor, partial [Deltaproteobacteria bacterium]|nr:outer membrane protein assembly factor [Deltaproteobacteria bacterium]
MPSSLENSNRIYPTPWCRAEIRLSCVLFLLVCLLSLPATAVAASESVRVVIEGLSGKELANVEAALAVPPTLIQEGKVDRLWLERFERQAPGKVREALEAFGYYKPAITINMDTPEEGVYRLVVRVDAGEPVRLTKVQVQVQGPGASETVLTKAVSDYPLHTGDVLRQDIYERSKGELQSKAAGLGYLDAQFSVHTIRLNEAESKAEINLVLETGRQYRFGEAHFLGAPRYPREYLQTFLDFQPGEPFSSEKILQTQLNLATAERFQSVVVQPDKAQAKDYAIPMNVELTPSPQKIVKVGV